VYLARVRIQGKFSYVLRQSYWADEHYKSRDLLDLGPEPWRFIHYPGGKGYYYDSCIEDALAIQGLKIESEDLDRLLFDFLDPEIQRVIIGFDRSHRKASNKCQSPDFGHPISIHIFDKRRFHYLRFGHSRQRYIQNVPDKVFKSLHHKSRDELEQYFGWEERRLRPNEKSLYVAAIFQLPAFCPRIGTDQSLLSQMDAYFMERLCRLNNDAQFLAGESIPQGLFEHLVKYAIVYFDQEPVGQSAAEQDIRNFINRHRRHRPTAKEQFKIREAEQLFGYEWIALKRLGRSALTRIFRQQALQHHPDQGGDAEKFRRLAHYYRVLLQRKPRS